MRQSVFKDFRLTIKFSIYNRRCRDYWGEISMATVNVVANYILDSLGFVSTMKLQKLAFYSQAYSLVYFDAPLFENDFQAWANGPVCPDLFALHRRRFIVGPGDLGSSDQSVSITRNERKSVDEVLSILSEYDGDELSKLTHEEAPWKNARGDVGDGERCSSVISKDSIKSYYSSPACDNPVFQTA